MKQLISTTIAILLLFGVANAQHVNIGIKGGLNGFTLHSDNSTNYNPRVGFNLGLLGHMHLSPSFAFQPEVQFSLQGAEYREGGADHSLKLNYVNIPLLVQYMFDNGFRLQAGPQLGILASASSVQGNSDSDVMQDYKSADVGLILGVSYVKPSTGFGIDLRYNHGLTSISASDATKSFNRGIQLGLFYLFQHHS